MKDTPRTNEWETYCDECYYHLWRVRRKNERGFNDGFHVQNGEGARQLVELLNKQDSELTAARAEIERLDTAGIHSCHKDCQRTNCVLRRERDELATCLASEKITRNHIVERASETERELAAVTEQRDRLAEALRELLTTGDNGYGTPTDKAWEMAEQALAAVEGGSDE